MTSHRSFAVFGCLGLALIGGACLAQTSGGATAASAGSGGAPMQAPTIQPMAGSGQVRQPPPNSAMRNSGGFGATGQMSVNPQGMAGMGTGMGQGNGAAMGTRSSTNGLTLSSTSSQRGGSGRRSGQGGETSVSDTGVTQRTPTDSSRR